MARIVDLMRNEQVTFSCELFPPKAGAQLDDVSAIAGEIARLSPSFMSVTYGAGGGNARFTASIAQGIQQDCGVPALAHLTCTASRREQIRATLEDLQSRGICNILALRGDLPQDDPFPEEGQYLHASDLIEDIRAFGHFCIGGACYPEGHPESRSMEQDILALKRKVEAGCEFLTTQMFFDNNVLYRFLYLLLKHGVDVPVAAGIMPVTNSKQIARICALSGTSLPPRFRAIVDRFGDDPAAMKQAGIAYATEQIIDLLANGVTHIHLYTMNKPDIARSILSNLSHIFHSLEDDLL